jgi:hypothetical protein
MFPGSISSRDGRPGTRGLYPLEPTRAEPMEVMASPARCTPRLAPWQRPRSSPVVSSLTFSRSTSTPTRTPATSLRLAVVRPMRLPPVVDDHVRPRIVLCGGDSPACPSDMRLRARAVRFGLQVLRVVGAATFAQRRWRGKEGGGQERVRTAAVISGWPKPLLDGSFSRQGFLRARARRLRSSGALDYGTPSLPTRRFRHESRSLATRGARARDSDSDA